MTELSAGLTYSLTIKVTDDLTVPSVSPVYTGFADMPPVFATAYMVGFVEWTCIEALRPYLEPDQGTVGTHIDISHVGASPVGSKVTAEIELLAINKRKLRFKVTCRDEAGLIGEGFHERAIIKSDTFMAGVLKRRDQADSNRRTA